MTRSDFIVIILVAERVIGCHNNYITKPVEAAFKPKLISISKSSCYIHFILKVLSV